MPSAHWVQLRPVARPAGLSSSAMLALTVGPKAGGSDQAVLLVIAAGTR